MAERMNIIAENYNAIISIEEKVINLQKYINKIGTKSYMSQNLLENCFQKMGEIVVRTKYVSSVSTKTKNIKKVCLDMSSHPRKGQTIAIDNNIRT